MILHRRWQKSLETWEDINPRLKCFLIGAAILIRLRISCLVDPENCNIVLQKSVFLSSYCNSLKIQQDCRFPLVATPLYFEFLVFWFRLLAALVPCGGVSAARWLERRRAMPSWRAAGQCCARGGSMVKWILVANQPPQLTLLGLWCLTSFLVPILWQSWLKSTHLLL